MSFSYSKYNPQIKLSPDEMLEISQDINREFAPVFSLKKPEPAYQHPLSAREMFDISEEIRLDFASKAANNSQELVLLPVDPDHIYAYWNLSDDRQYATPKDKFGNQLTLRIYSEPTKNKDLTMTNSWFDVAIDSAKAQQKVPLSMHPHETAYRATIGERFSDNNFTPFVSSNITYVPPRKVIPAPVKERQIIFEPMLPFITTSVESLSYTNNNASGQGTN